MPANVLLSSGRGLSSYVRISSSTALILIGASIYLADYGLLTVATGIACISAIQSMILLIESMRIYNIPVLPIIRGIAAPLIGVAGMISGLALLDTETSPLYLPGWSGLLGQLMVGLGIYAAALWMVPHSLVYQEIKRLNPRWKTFALSRYRNRR